MKAFRYEFFRNCKKLKIYFLFYLLISVVLIQIGIIGVKNIYNEEKGLINLERILTERYINYSQYGSYGIKLKMNPDGIAALFINTSPFIDIETFIDSGVRLNFTKVITPDNAMGQNGYIDFSWFIIVIGSLLVTVWGWETYRDKKLIKLLISIAGRNVKFEIMVARAAIILIGVLVLLLVSTVQIMINGLDVNVLYISIFFGIAFLNYLFWLILSSYIGIIRSTKRIITLAVIWLGLVMMLPELEKCYYHNYAKSVVESKARHDEKKIEILMKFEENALKEWQKKATQEEKMEADKKSAAYYKKVEHPKLVNLEKKLISSLKEIVKNYQLISALTPITFMKSTGCEIATGYNGYLKFYTFTLKKQREFMLYILDHLYFMTPVYGKVTPFIGGEEHLFSVESSLPKYSMLGLAWLLVLIGLIMWLNKRKFDEILFCYDHDKLGILDLLIKEGEINVLLTGNEIIKQNIFNHLSGATSTMINLKIIAENKIEGRNNLVYLYKEMDKIPLNELEKLFYKNNEYKKSEFWKIACEYSKSRKSILIFDEYLDDLKKYQRKEILEHIRINKILALIITNRREMAFSLVSGDDIMYMCEDNTIDLG